MAVAATAEMRPEHVARCMQARREGGGGLVVHIFDSAGQPVFDAFRSLLYSRGSTAYLAVFSLARLADRRDRDECLGELAMHLNGVSACVGTDPKPPVLLVGTRKGGLSADKLREISTLLETHLQPCPAFAGRVCPAANSGGGAPNGGLCYFAIENTKGFEGDETIRTLAAAVQSTIGSLPALKSLVPSRWIHVSDELRQRAAAGKTPALALPEVCAIASACGLPHASHGLTLEAEVERMLLYFHGLGAVVWFPEAELREMVVLEPQWLLDAMSCPIRDFDLHRLPQDDLCRREMQKEWTLLVAHSRLRLSLLSKLWASDRFAPHFEPLVRLMAKYALGVPLAVPASARGSGKEELLVPPLLRFGRPNVPLSAVDATADEWPELCRLLFVLETDDRADDLVWYDEPPGEGAALREGYVPEAILNQLWAAALSWSNHTTSGSAEPHITHGAAYVAFGSQRVLLRRHGERPCVSVRVRGTARATVLERLRLLLEGVLRRAAHLRCLMLLPLPGMGGSVLISYSTLRAMGAGQVGRRSPGLGPA